jgi:uncharacterized membrane protein AbrB (regulator of aidB expression)
MLVGGGVPQKVKVTVQVLLVIALLVIYCVQIKGFNVQAGILLAIMIASAGLSFFNREEEAGGAADTVLAGLIGFSIGLVISNSQIQIVK